MIPTKSEVLAYANAKIEEMKVFSNKRFDLQIDRMIIDINFKDTNRLGLGGRHNGLPFIRFNLGKLIKYEVAGYNEYANLQRYVGITSFYTKSWKLWLDALIAHEFAHAVQYALPISRSSLSQGKNYFQGLGKAESGHGPFFRKIYRILRDEFVNMNVSDVYHSVKHFDIPEEVIADIVAAKKAKRAAAMHTDHYLIGSKIPFRNKIYTIREVNTRSRKYPLVAYNDSGERLNMPEDYALAHRI